MANARELGEVDMLCSSSCSLRHCELEDRITQEKEKQSRSTGEGVIGSPKGMLHVGPVSLLKSKSHACRTLHPTIGACEL